MGVYEVGNYNVSKDGDVTFSDRTDSEEVEMLVEALLDRGFEPDVEIEEKPDNQETENHLKSIPAVKNDTEQVEFKVNVQMNGFDPAALNRLHDIIESKKALLQKALDLDDLKFVVEDDHIEFPWFRGEPDGDLAEACTMLVLALCQMAKDAKHVNVKHKEVENEKYTFRCFLLRLGFIGDKYKKARKVLLENLEGSGAFRNSRKG